MSREEEVVKEKEELKFEWNASNQWEENEHKCTHKPNRSWTGVLPLGDGVCGRAGVCVRQNRWTNEGSVMMGVTHSSHRALMEGVRRGRRYSRNANKTKKSNEL